MKDLTKSQVVIGLLAYFATVWILIEVAKSYGEPLFAVGIVALMFIVMLVLSYIIMTILEWIKIFDLRTNAVLTLIVLTTLMITLTVYLLINPVTIQ